MLLVSTLRRLSVFDWVEEHRVGKGAIARDDSDASKFR